MWGIFNRPSTQASSSLPSTSQPVPEYDVAGDAPSQAGPSRPRNSQAVSSQAGPSRPRPVNVVAGRSGATQADAILLSDSDEDMGSAATDRPTLQSHRSPPRPTQMRRLTGAAGAQVPRRSAVTPVVDTDDDDIVLMGSTPIPAKPSCPSHGAPSHSASTRDMPIQGTPSGSTPSRGVAQHGTPAQVASASGTLPLGTPSHDPSSKGVFRPRLSLSKSTSMASATSTSPTHDPQATHTSQAPKRTTSLHRSSALERRKALGPTAGIGKTPSRGLVSTPSQSPVKAVASQSAIQSARHTSASPARLIPQHLPSPSTPVVHVRHELAPRPNATDRAGSMLPNPPPASAVPSTSVPISRTLSAMSSASSQSVIALTSTPPSAEDRKARLQALRESGRKKAQAARPISSVDVSSRPGSPSFMGKVKRTSSLTPKDDKKRLTASPTNLLRAQGSHLAVSATADSPLKRAVRMSSPAVVSSQRTADVHDEDPLDARERRGERRGVDLVEEMRKSSTSYGEGEEEEGDGVAASRVGSPAPRTEELVTPVIGAEGAEAIEDEEDFLLALQAEYGHYEIPEPSPPAGVSEDLSGPATVSELAAIVDAPSTPPRRPLRLDPAHTHAAGTRAHSMDPEAARSRRHLTLSPKATRTDLAGVRSRRLSGDGTQTAVVTLSWLSPRKASVDPTVTKTKERGLEDIIREQQEEEARVKARQELEMQNQADRWNASDDETVSGDDGSDDDSDLSSVPESEPDRPADDFAEEEAASAPAEETRRADVVLPDERQVGPQTSKTDEPPAAVEDPKLVVTSAKDAGQEKTASMADGADAMASLLGNSKTNKTEVDVLRQIAAGAATAEAHWSGIWEKPEWRPDVASLKVRPMPEVEGCAWLAPLLELACTEPLPLLTVLASGACVDVLGSEGIGPCEVLQMVIDTALSGRYEAPLALQTALPMIATASTNPFSSSQGLLGKISHTITSFGMRAEMRHLFPAHKCPDDACDVGCGWRMRDRDEGLSIMAMIVAACVECDWLDSEHAVQIARLFLFICIDPHTKPSTVHALQAALSELWPLCLDYNSAVGMASEIYDVARDLPPLAQRRLLEAIGSTSHAAIEIARWLGMGLLLPGCLNDISVSSAVPPLQWILGGTMAINKNVVDADHDTDHGLLATQIEALCAAMNDLSQMALTEPGTASNVRRIFDQTRRNLKVAGDSIPRTISTSHQGINNKMRLNQLTNLFDVQTARLLEKRVAQRERARLAKGRLVLGQGGKGGNQTRLNFAPVRAEHGADESEDGDADETTEVEMDGMEEDDDTGREEGGGQAADIAPTGTGGIPRTPVTASLERETPSPSMSRTRFASEASEDEGRDAKRRRLDATSPDGPLETAESCHQGGAAGSPDEALHATSATQRTTEAITEGHHIASSPRYITGHPSITSDRFYTPPPTAPDSRSDESSADSDDVDRDDSNVTKIDAGQHTPAGSTSPPPTGMVHRLPQPRSQPSPPGRSMSQLASFSLTGRINDAALYIARKAGIVGDRTPEEVEVCSGRSPSPVM